MPPDPMMTVFTVHLRPRSAPELIPEGFSWGAAILGPLWLLAHRAWIAATLAACAEIAVAEVTDGTLTAVLAAATAWSLGLFGNDLRRWSLSLRGYRLARVIAAAGTDLAFARLLEQRPDLAAEALA